MTSRHVYLHIPFCQHICRYCGFFKSADAGGADRYVEQAGREIQAKGNGPVQTLYFGGGTPSLLSPAQFEKLAASFLNRLQAGYEWTVEANPESLSPEKIALYKKLGVNRISLGVQSFQDELLERMGRHHTAELARQRIAQLREAGIDNISADLIYALPGQNLELLKADLQAFLELDLPHLSIYSLQIEENSVWGKQGLEPADEELEADMYECIVSTLKSAGYEHYEISSFARPGYYGKHNLAYWQDEDFTGIGPGASGRDPLRYTNKPDLAGYLVHGPEPVVESSLEEAPFEAIMMGLRTRFGFSVTDWQQKYHRSFLSDYQDVLKRWTPEYLHLENGYLKPGEKGMEILNTILVDFLEAEEAISAPED